MTEVLPCIRRGARTTRPPKTSAIDWWPRQTPSTGISPAKARIMAIDTPACCGVPGPGEMHRCVGRHSRAASTVSASLRCTLHLGAEHQEGLHQVVGEGVVVVDQQQARAHSPSSASRSACTAAALLASTSSCSLSGTLSATMPAPAW